MDETRVQQVDLGCVSIGMRGAMRWLMTSLTEAAEDRAADETEPIPLVPMGEEDCLAVEDDTFQKLLSSLGMNAPIEHQEMYWRIPANVTLADLLSRSELLGKALEGRLQELISTDTTSADVSNTSVKKSRIRAALFDSDSEIEGENIVTTALERSVQSSSSRMSPMTVNSSDDEGTSASQQTESIPAKKKKAIGTKSKSAKKAKAVMVDSSDEETGSLNNTLVNVNTTPQTKKAKSGRIMAIESSDEEEVSQTPSQEPNKHSTQNGHSNNSKQNVQAKKSIEAQTLNSSDEESNLLESLQSLDSSRFNSSNRNFSRVGPLSDDGVNSSSMQQTPKVNGKESTSTLSSPALSNISSAKKLVLTNPEEDIIMDSSRKRIRSQVLDSSDDDGPSTSTPKTVKKKVHRIDSDDEN